jgi:hypothetical protein
MRNDIEIAIDILFMQNKIKSNDLAGFLNDWKINSKKFMVFDAHGKYVVNPDLDFIYKYAIGGLIFDATNRFTSEKIRKAFTRKLDSELSRVDINKIMKELKEQDLKEQEMVE